MTIMEMLAQSGVMTVLGVGTVFMFLVIMVISVTLMGKIIQALGLNKDAKATAGSGSPAKEATANHGATVAAITAAVNEYQKENH